VCRLFATCPVFSSWPWLCGPYRAECSVEIFFLTHSCHGCDLGAPYWNSYWVDTSCNSTTWVCLTSFLPMSLFQIQSSFWSMCEVTCLKWCVLVSPNPGCHHHVSYHGQDVWEIAFPEWQQHGQAAAMIVLSEFNFWFVLFGLWRIWTCIGGFVLLLGTMWLNYVSEQQQKVLTAPSIENTYLFLLFSS
jgi:hypothetical protein